MKYKPQHPDAFYLDTYWFLDECEIRCQTTKIVTVAKAHICHGVTGEPAGGHMIAVGERAYYEHALVDGSDWCSSWVCLECIDEYVATHPEDYL